MADIRRCKTKDAAKAKQNTSRVGIPKRDTTGHRMIGMRMRGQGSAEDERDAIESVTERGQDGLSRRWYPASRRHVVVEQCVRYGMILIGISDRPRTRQDIAWRYVKR